MRGSGILVTEAAIINPHLSHGNESMYCWSCTKETLHVTRRPRDMDVFFLRKYFWEWKQKNEADRAKKATSVQLWILQKV